MSRQKAAAPAPTAAPPRRVRLSKPIAPADWFAEIDGKRYPLALQRWASFGAGGSRYRDPRSVTGKAATPSGEDYAAALREGAVVLMRSTETRGAGGATVVKREGPIGLYRIANVAIDADAVAFDFVERIGMF